jgi:hypothetical protein
MGRDPVRCVRNVPTFLNTLGGVIAHRDNFKSDSTHIMCVCARCARVVCVHARGVCVRGVCLCVRGVCAHAVCVLAWRVCACVVRVRA